VDRRQFSFTAPTGVALSALTWTGGSPVYAIIGAVVTVLPCLLPYGFFLFMILQGKPVTVKDHGVKITLDSTASKHQFDMQELGVLGSVPSNRTKENPMLRTVDRLTAFSEVKLPTTDPKVKARANKCSACGALVGPMDTHQHRKFHEDVRAIAKEAGLAG